MSESKREELARLMGGIYLCWYGRVSQPSLLFAGSIRTEVWALTEPATKPEARSRMRLRTVVFIVLIMFPSRRIRAQTVYGSRFLIALSVNSQWYSSRL